MSTYTTCEAALLTTLRAYGFSELASSRGDFSILNNAGVTQAAVLIQASPSEFGDNLGQGRGTYGKRHQRHRIAVVVFQSRGQSNDGVSYTTLGTLTDAVITYLDKYPRLGTSTSIKRAEVTEASEIRARRDKAWIYQTLLVEVLTETTPALAEGPH